MLSPVFKPFVEKSPISVMARGMMERVLNPDQLNEWFDATGRVGRDHPPPRQTGQADFPHPTFP
jgi:hypothetical protein